MKIYVASSWRNDYQPAVVKALEEAGHEVYDFKNPDWSNCGQPGSGFHWSEIDRGWKEWSFEQYLKGLCSDLAETGFKSDMGMPWSGLMPASWCCHVVAARTWSWAGSLGKGRLLVSCIAMT